MEQRSDAVTVGCACTGGTSSLRCTWLRCNITRTAPHRGQSTATRSGKRAVLPGEDPGPSPPPPPPELFSLSEEEPNGGRPGSVTDPAPQERVARHIVEHMVEPCPFVQILDAPVRQGGNQLLEAFQHIDLHVPEQAIEVPKISPLPRRSRRRWVPLVQEKKRKGKEKQI